MTLRTHQRKSAVALLALTACLLALQPAASAAKRDLRVYFIDVEGGQSTLFVTPTGQSLLCSLTPVGLTTRAAMRTAFWLRPKARV
jgi:competence protein ComEC